MATTNKDFVVKQGLKVATGITFPDNTVQTTAYTGADFVAPTASSSPSSPVNGQIYFNVINQRLEIYYDGALYVIALYNDVLGSSIGDGNGVEQPLITGTIDGGYPSSTYNSTIDGGNPESFLSILNGGFAGTSQFVDTVDAGIPNETFWVGEYDGGTPQSPFY